MDETILVNYLQGECNDEEAARVEAWCEEGPENRKALEQLYYTLFVGAVSYTHLTLPTSDLV